MVALVDKRHASTHCPQPQTFKPKANTMANVPNFPEPFYNFWRIPGDAKNLPKHP
jgi:hypothetical protein